MKDIEGLSGFERAKIKSKITCKKIILKKNQDVKIYRLPCESERGKRFGVWRKYNNCKLKCVTSTRYSLSLSLLSQARLNSAFSNNSTHPAWTAFLFFSAIIFGVHPLTSSSVGSARSLNNISMIFFAPILAAM